MKKIIIAILLIVPFFTNAQIITTFAGCGTSCTGLGDGGLATDAVVADPIGGTFDKLGNYYFAEAISGQRIRKVATNGIITTVAGNGSSGYSGDSGPATSAMLSDPVAVKLDTTGNIYICDNNNARIRKVNIATGIITTIAGTGTTGFGGDSGLATTALLYDPSDICFDKKGNLYIADAVNERVRMINTAGLIYTIAGTGASGSTGDLGPATAAELNFPSGLAIDDTGNIYIAENSGNHVRKIDTFGIITTVAGNGAYTYVGDGVPATSAQINPGKLGLDDSGNLFIADQYNKRVYKVNHAGILHTVAGNGFTGFSGDNALAIDAAIDYPSGIAFDSCGNLYIPDVNNRRIRKVDFNPGCKPDTALNIDTIGFNSISAYPNPATTELTITSTNKITQVIMTNIIGQIVQSETPNAEKIEVNISTLPLGVYFVKVTDGQGQKTITKIIKQ